MLNQDMVFVALLLIFNPFAAIAKGHTPACKEVLKRTAFVKPIDHYLQLITRLRKEKPPEPVNPESILIEDLAPGMRVYLSNEKLKDLTHSDPQGLSREVEVIKISNSDLGKTIQLHIIATGSKPNVFLASFTNHVFPTPEYTKPLPYKVGTDLKIDAPIGMQLKIFNDPQNYYAGKTFTETKPDNDENRSSTYVGKFLDINADNPDELIVSFEINEGSSYSIDLITPKSLVSDLSNQNGLSTVFQRIQEINLTFQVGEIVRYRLSNGSIHFGKIIKRQGDKIRIRNESTGLSTAVPLIDLHKSFSTIA